MAKLHFFADKIIMDACPVPTFETYLKLNKKFGEGVNSLWSCAMNSDKRHFWGDFDLSVLNRESGGSESCKSSRAMPRSQLNIDWKGAKGRLSLKVTVKVNSGYFQGVFRRRQAMSRVFSGCFSLSPLRFPLSPSKLIGCDLDWRFWLEFPRFYLTAIPLILVLLAAEILAIPGPQLLFCECVPPRVAKTCVLRPVLRNVPVTPTPSIFPKVLPYKWGVDWRTNGRRLAVQIGGVLQGFPFLRSFEARKVRRYKWGAYCRTNWRCTAVLS